MTKLTCHKCGRHIRHCWRCCMASGYVAAVLMWDLLIVVVPALAAVFLLSAIACGADESSGGVYRLHTSEQIGNTIRDSQGSCTAIEVDGDKRVHFLTARHVWGTNPRVQIHSRFVSVELVTTLDAKPEPLVVARTIAAYDNRPPVKVYDVATEEAAAGDVVWSVGYRFGEYTEIYDRVKARSQDGHLTLARQQDSGASGGPVLNSRGRVVGVISGVNDRRNETYCMNAVEATTCDTGRLIQWKCTPRGCRPRYVQPFVGLPVGPPMVAVPPPQYRPPVSPPPTKTQTLIGPEGPRGPKGDTPQVDYERIIAAILKQMPKPKDGFDGVDGRDGKDGQPGPRGPAGPRGLVGVPSADDIQNWLNGSPQVLALIQRLEVLESTAGDSSALQTLIQRLEALEKRTQTIYVGDKRTKRIIDEETYGPGEPYVIDISKILEKLERVEAAVAAQ